MKNFDIQTLESDLHRLDLRFASLRLRQSQRVERLARSIEQNGQLVPVVAVAEQKERWVLIDGNLRIQALCRLGRDTAWVELWDCPLSQALLIVLVGVQGRSWEAIEEGAIIRELITRFELTQREVAQQIGRDASWVNRRLSLVQELPEALFSAICQGELSTWAATRILTPVGARQQRTCAEAVGCLATRPALYPRVTHLVPPLPEGQSPATPTHVGTAPPVLSGPAGASPRTGSQSAARRARGGLAFGVKTDHSTLARAAKAAAARLCRGPGNTTATTGLGGGEDPFSGFRPNPSEVYSA